jgi:Fe-S cluster assembly protein SufD
VVHEDGKADMYGKIIVKKGAQHTESFLQERVLLVDDESCATAIPNLEIKAQEVKCSHAAAVGKIDEEQLFYLMSRGLSKKKATDVIVEGFLQEVRRKIKT